MIFSRIRNKFSKTKRQRVLVLGMLLTVGYLFLIVTPVFAQLPPPEFADTIVLPKSTVSLPTIIARIINVALSFLGIVAVGIILYGGYLWMTSQGNEEIIGKAKKTLINAAIGLIIILSAFILAQYILKSLMCKVFSVCEEVPLAATGVPELQYGGGALGSGIVENHYPFRGQTGVPRNTKIVITFKEPMKIESIVDTEAKDAAGKNQYFIEEGGNKKPAPIVKGGKSMSALTLRDDAIHLARTDVGDIAKEGKMAGQKIRVTFTSDLRTWIFSPDDYLGEAVKNVPYMVYICGTKTTSPVSGKCQPGGIKLAPGGSAFLGAFGDYQWPFETSTALDLTPPTISSVVPIFDDEQDAVNGTKKDKQDKPKNVLIQVNFSEPVLPTVASGKTTIEGGGTSGQLVIGTFGILRVSGDSGLNYLGGEWQIGNQYKTSEFTPSVLCGKNACGQDVFCLPGPAKISAKVLTASLASPSDKDKFESAGSLDGVEDLAGNVLNGNKDKKAQGPVGVYNLNSESGLGDNVEWAFWTLGSIDLTSPWIEKTTPGIKGSGVPLKDPVLITFNKPMSITTLNSKNMNLSGMEIASQKPWDTWWWVGADNIPLSPPPPVPPVEPEKTEAIITHGGFWEVSDFQTEVSNKVKDLYQNCYFPTGGVVCGDPTSADSPLYCCNGAWQGKKCF